MKTLFLFTAFAICQISIGQNGLYITSGGFLDNENGKITIVNGHFISNSSTDLSGGALQMNGTDGNTHNIELSQTNTMDYLGLNGISSFELDGQLTLNKEILLNDTSSFIMNKGSFITLGPTAEIVGEYGTNTITGANGTYIKTTRNHTAGATNDFGLIGVETPNVSTSMGITEIYRRYGTFDINGNPTVKRYYEINPTVNSGLNIEARFYLTDIDLNGLERSNLAAFRSVDNGATFTKVGGTAETLYHTVSNLDAFSLWTFADASTLNIDTVHEQSFAVFPNPANAQVSIIPNNGTVITAIQLFNVFGQKINRGLSDGNTFSVSGLAEGIYLLNILSLNGEVTKKLVVKK